MWRNLLPPLVLTLTPALILGGFAHGPRIAAYDPGVASASGDPTVISTIPVGSRPWGVAVNPVTNRIYVTNSWDYSASVIDGATNTVVATIPVGGNPWGVAVNPTTNRIYVVNYTSDNVSVIDGGTNTVVATVPVGYHPVNAAVNPDTNRIYVSNNDNASVSVIDGGTDTAVATVPVGNWPDGVAVNPTTNRIYVTNHWDHSVLVIDGATNTVVATVPLGSDPGHVAVNAHTNRIYVESGDSDSDNLSVIDGGTNTLVDTVPLGSDPVNVAVNPDTNRISLTNHWNDDVSIIDGGTDTLVATVAVGHGPYGVAVNPTTSRIYVANSGDDTVSVIEDCPDGSCGGPAPGILITKTGPSSVSAVVGTAVDYTITLQNNTSATASGLAVTDPLPDALHPVSATWSRSSPAGSGACSLTGSIVTCAVGDLAAGGSTSISLSATLRYIPTTGSVSNMACWTATDPSPAGVNCATAVTGVGSTATSADLRLTMIGPGSVAAVVGADVEYQLSVDNVGAGTADGVIVRDWLPPRLGSVSAAWVNTSEGTSGGCDVEGTLVTCNVGTVTQVGGAEVTISAEVALPTSGYMANWAYVYPTDSNPQNSRALWRTVFSGSHRKVVLVQGIDSESQCGEGFRPRVRWIEDYLSGADPRGRWIRDQYFYLQPWTDSDPGDFRYFSYSNNYDCAGGMAHYAKEDTCAGVQAAANKLDELIQGLVGEDPYVQIDLITHSMGGLVAAKWLVDHKNDNIIRGVNSVITFDSPLRGLANLQWALKLDVLGTACRVPAPRIGFLPLQSMFDLLQVSPIVGAASAARDLADFYTIDATASEIVVGGRRFQAVPTDDTDFDREPDHAVDRTHTGVWQWDPMPSAVTAPPALKRFIGCRVTRAPDCSQVSQQLQFLTSGETQRIGVAVSPEAAMLATSTSWAEASIRTSLEAPDGGVIDVGTADPAVRRYAGQGYELYEVDHPQPGVWTIVVTADAVPPGGEDVFVGADPVTPPPPDEDEDGSPDGEDNCQSVSNANQRDVDSDGVGDACDPDIDNDGLLNASDNCPGAANADQIDLDGDGLGEPCDGDNDNDFMLDAEEALHVCLSTSVDDSADDPDTDGLANLTEVWLGTDPCQADTDSDGMPDSYEVTNTCLDPIAPDATSDPDGDGRDNLTEYGLGSDPCVSGLAVGGIAELPDLAGASVQQAGAPPTGSRWSAATYAPLAAALAAALLAGGAAWYVVRRRANP
jgi:uncharacterized repeat protein (TIGR01451 family)